jgi:hypothetical protein
MSPGAERRAFSAKHRRLSRLRDILGSDKGHGRRRRSRRPVRRRGCRCQACDSPNSRRGALADERTISRARSPSIAHRVRGRRVHFVRVCAYRRTGWRNRVNPRRSRMETLVTEAKIYVMAGLGVPVEKQDGLRPGVQNCVTYLSYANAPQSTSRADRLTAHTGAFVAGQSSHRRADLDE